VAVESYRDQGYVPDAFCNYLALLGWSPPGEAEKVDRDTLVREFRLSDVHHAPARFDVHKLTHMNGEYLRELPLGEFVAAARPWIDPVPGEWVPPQGPPWPAERFDPSKFERLAPLVQERVATLGEVPGMVDFVFLADPPLDDTSWSKAIGRDQGAPAILADALEAYSACDWSAEELGTVTRELAERHGRKLAKAQAPIRVAVTGRTVGPPLFESLEVLGRDEVQRRLRAALERATDDQPG
jgi:glutamyl-tRNA synthetase